MNDEEFDEDYLDEYLTENILDDLKQEEIEFRVEKCLNILREVVDNVQIHCSYQLKSDEGTALYHSGIGDEGARKFMCEHFMSIFKESWGL